MEKKQLETGASKMELLLFKKLLINLTAKIISYYGSTAIAVIQASGLET